MATNLHDLFKPLSFPVSHAHFWLRHRCWSLFLLAAAWVDPGRSPSVSWTKMLETFCLQQQKEMLNIKCVQKHAKGHRYHQVSNTEKKAESQRAQRRGLRWNPKESTCARVGRCNQGRGLWWKNSAWWELLWECDCVRGVCEGGLRGQQRGDSHSQGRLGTSWLHQAWGARTGRRGGRWSYRPPWLCGMKFWRRRGFCGS